MPSPSSRAKAVSPAQAVPVFLAFLAMGFLDAVGPFVSQAKQQFDLSNFTAQLVAFTGFIMFGILAVPMGIYQDKKGKKFILILGLAIMLGSVLIPTIMGLSTFPVFLLTILLLGAGGTILQVAGNPLMRDVSAEDKFSRNLSLAQFVKAIGSLSGPLIPVIAASVFGFGWQVVFPVYSIAIAVALIAGLMLNVPAAAAPAGRKPASVASCLALLKSGYVTMMVLAIFLYVGAEVCVSSGAPLYLKDRFGVDINKVGLLGTGLFFLALTIGRFSGGVILNWLKPKMFFSITCVLSVVGLLGLFIPSGTVAGASFFLVGLGFANIFPLVFSITIDRMPEHTNELSGLMVMAIVGGAFVPPLMGWLADATGSVQTGFVVPLMAVLYILWVAIWNSLKTRASS
jgi:MFS transporter, FHS family, L-fucose permease